MVASKFLLTTLDLFRDLAKGRASDSCGEIEV
jgi:hypothetical protein